MNEGEAIKSKIIMTTMNIPITKKQYSLFKQIIKANFTCNEYLAWNGFAMVHRNKCKQSVQIDRHSLINLNYADFGL